MNARPPPTSKPPTQKNTIKYFAIKNWIHIRPTLSSDGTPTT